MTQEKIDELLNHDRVEQKKVDMGIGMNYVHRVLEAHHDGKAEVCIDSQPGQGTTVWLVLPLEGKAPSSQQTEGKNIP